MQPEPVHNRDFGGPASLDEICSISARIQVKFNKGGNFCVSANDGNGHTVNVRPDTFNDFLLKNYPQATIVNNAQGYLIVELGVLHEGTPFGVFYEEFTKTNEN
jgi:hypothetical protein